MAPSPPPPVVVDNRKRPATATPTPSPAAKHSRVERSSGGTPGTTTSAASSGSSSKAYKGLRHFSMMVCKKVEEKGTTSYNEVADELVQHVIAQRKQADPQSACDEKNIRRRVYDALNVLMAMDIISKDKKAISWRGLPTAAHADLEMLQRERTWRKAAVEQKRDQLRELIAQQVCFRNLLQRNHERPPVQQERTIPLPFIVVNTHSSAIIQCNMSRELTDVAFEFSQPFEINDDNTILKRLGMHRTNHATLQSIFPEELVQYADQHGLLQDMVLLDEGVAPVAPPPPLGATVDYMASF